MQKKKNKKDKDKKGGAAGTGGITVVTADSPSIGNISAKNLQEILQKLTVDEKIKPHEFWDSQPVPKLRECATRFVFYECINLAPKGFTHLGRAIPSSLFLSPPFR